MLIFMKKKIDILLRKWENDGIKANINFTTLTNAFYLLYRNILAVNRKTYKG